MKLKKIQNTKILLILVIALIFASFFGEVQSAQKPKVLENIAIPADYPPIIDDFTVGNHVFYLTYEATLRDETGIASVRIEITGPFGGDGESWSYFEPYPTEVLINSSYFVGNRAGDYSVEISVTDNRNHTKTETRHLYVG
jgi:hypothetical protein